MALVVNSREASVDLNITYQGEVKTYQIPPALEEDDPQNPGRKIIVKGVLEVPDEFLKKARLNPAVEGLFEGKILAIRKVEKEAPPAAKTAEQKAAEAAKLAKEQADEEAAKKLAESQKTPEAETAAPAAPVVPPAAP